MIRKHAVLSTRRKEIRVTFILEIEGKILLMLTAAKLFCRKQVEAQIKKDRKKQMSNVQNKWDFFLKKIVLKTVEITIPMSTGG